MGVEEFAVQRDLKGAGAVLAALVSGDLEIGEFFFQRPSQLLELGPVVSLLAVFDVEFHGGGSLLWEGESRAQETS